MMVFFTSETCEKKKGKTNNTHVSKGIVTQKSSRKLKFQNWRNENSKTAVFLH
jgi:hypothetical protein